MENERVDPGLSVPPRERRIPSRFVPALFLLTVTGFLLVLCVTIYSISQSCVRHPVADCDSFNHADADCLYYSCWSGGLFLGVPYRCNYLPAPRLDLGCAALRLLVAPLAFMAILLVAFGMAAWRHG